MQTPIDPDLVSLEEAAATLGTTTVNILMNLKRGLLEGREIEGCWWVSRASLAAHGGNTREAVAQPHCRRSTCGSCGQH
ncbi:hypothetical protein [Geoalkalibacter sp.]|uniref:hypothetical protein n=1 Tax=Geoalkalibacter sp. TaxID=3041440 RepID=UPI00272DD677|nr:hypothetical protein [Geoalkalibacter sp.]